MSIGAALAEARQRAGLTVGQVSERTRIRETVIRGIERDDYSGCGGDFYARGHIRGIAKAVGADPGPLVEEYDAVCRSPEVLSRVSLEELLATSALTPRRRRPTLPAMSGLVAAARSALRHQVGSSAVPGPVVPAARSPRRRLGWTVALALTVALGLGLYSLVAGPRQPGVAPSAAGKGTVRPQQAGPSKSVLVPKRSHAAAPHSPARAVPARTLTPVTAAAPRSSGGGHSPLAHRAVEAHRAAAVVSRPAYGRPRHHRKFGGHGPGHEHRPGHEHGPGHGHRPGHEHGPGHGHRPGHEHGPGHGHGPDKRNGKGHGNGQNE